MHNTTRTISPALALAAALAFVPVSAVAQTPVPLTPAAPAMCVGELSPASVQAGVKAVAITVQVTETMGAVTGFEAGEDSGILLAVAADLPKTEMARGTPATPAPAARPINMADAANTWTVWINVAEAEAGTSDVTFTSSSGKCTAHLEVKPSA
jgi:hypothetical protein